MVFVVTVAGAQAAGDGHARARVGGAVPVPAWVVADRKTVATDTASNTRARWPISIHAGGGFQLGIGNMLLFDDGQIAVDRQRNRMVFTERVAKGERCAGAARVGTYTYRRTVATLTLTEVRNPCRRRHEILTAKPLARVAR